MKKIEDVAELNIFLYDLGTSKTPRFNSCEGGVSAHT